MLLSKRAGRRRVSVIAPISTYLQRATCFTDSEETAGGEGGVPRRSILTVTLGV